MTKLNLIRSTAALIGAASLLQPASARAAEQPLRISSDSAERRIVITTASAADAAGEWAGVLPVGGVVFRLSIETVQDPSALSADWLVELVSPGGGTALRLAGFDPRNREWSLPKPLGLRFEAGDSIAIRVRLPQGEALPGWRIVAEYEPLDGPQTRLAVLPFEIAAAVTADSVGRRAWEWTSPASGRLLALAGLSVTGTTELVLEDVESGQAVWREVVRGGATEAFGCPQGVVRAGVVVAAGRTYRLSADAGEADAVAAALTGYVLPAARAPVN